MRWPSRIEWRAANSGGIVLLLVAHAIKSEREDEVIRIISARRATTRERKRYVENREE
jgi:hypothetical protein